MVSNTAVLEFEDIIQIDVNREYTTLGEKAMWELQILTGDFKIYEGAKYSTLTPNGIKRVIFSDPCTIILWNDGTKTIVRCTDEKFDKEKGLAMCIAKKVLGNKGKYYDVFKKWIEEDDKK